MLGQDATAMDVGHELRPVVVFVSAEVDSDVPLRDALSRRGFHVVPAPAQHAADVIDKVAPDVLCIVASDEGVDTVSSALATATSRSVPVLVLGTDPAVGPMLRRERPTAAQVMPKDSPRDEIVTRVATLAAEAHLRFRHRVSEEGTATLEQVVQRLGRERRTTMLVARTKDLRVEVLTGAARPPRRAVDIVTEKFRGRAAAESIEVESTPTLALPTLSDPSVRAVTPTSYEGLRVVVAYEDSGRANGLEKALRAKGTLLLTAPLAKFPIARADEFDPHLLLIEAPALEALGVTSLDPIRTSLRLRWAPLLIASWDELWPRGASLPLVARVAAAAAPILAMDRFVAATSKGTVPGAFRIETCGPARALRAGAFADRSLRLAFRTANLISTVDFAPGLCVSATTFRGGTKLEGIPAISALLAEVAGRVVVSRNDVPTQANIMTPLDEVLVAAYSDARSFIPPDPPVAPPMFFGVPSSELAAWNATVSVTTGTVSSTTQAKPVAPAARPAPPVGPPFGGKLAPPKPGIRNVASSTLMNFPALKDLSAIAAAAGPITAEPAAVEAPKLTDPAPAEATAGAFQRTTDPNVRFAAELARDTEDEATTGTRPRPDARAEPVPIHTPPLPQPAAPTPRGRMDVPRPNIASPPRREESPPLDLFASPGLRALQPSSLPRIDQPTDGVLENVEMGTDPFEAPRARPAPTAAAIPAPQVTPQDLRSPDLARAHEPEVGDTTEPLSIPPDVLQPADSSPPLPAFPSFPTAPQPPSEAGVATLAPPPVLTHEAAAAAELGFASTMLAAPPADAPFKRRPEPDPMLEATNVGTYSEAMDPMAESTNVGSYAGIFESMPTAERELLRELGIPELPELTDPPAPTITEAEKPADPNALLPAFDPSTPTPVQAMPDAHAVRSPTSSDAPTGMYQSSGGQLAPVPLVDDTHNKRTAGYPAVDADQARRDHEALETAKRSTSTAPSDPPLPVFDLTPSEESVLPPRRFPAFAVIFGIVVLALCVAGYAYFAGYLGPRGATKIAEPPVTPVLDAGSSSTAEEDAAIAALVIPADSEDASVDALADDAGVDSGSYDAAPLDALALLVTADALVDSPSDTAVDAPKDAAKDAGQDVVDAGSEAGVDVATVTATAVTTTPEEAATAAGTPDEGAAPTPTEGTAPTDSVDSLLARAQIALREGRADDAYATYQQVLAASDRNPHAYAGLARAALARNNPTAAVEWARKAVSVRARRAAYRVLLGDALKAAGDTAGANRAYDEAREIDPYDPAVQRIR